MSKRKLLAIVGVALMGGALQAGSVSATLDVKGTASLGSSASFVMVGLGIGVAGWTCRRRKRV